MTCAGPSTCSALTTTGNKNEFEVTLDNTLAGDHSFTITVGFLGGYSTSHTGSLEVACTSASATITLDEASVTSPLTLDALGPADTAKLKFRFPGFVSSNPKCPITYQAPYASTKSDTAIDSSLAPIFNSAKLCTGLLAPGACASSCHSRAGKCSTCGTQYCCGTGGAIALGCISAGSDACVDGWACTNNYALQDATGWYFELKDTTTVTEYEFKIGGFVQHITG